MSGFGSFAGAFGGSAVGSAVVRLVLDTKQYDAQLAAAKGKTEAGTAQMGASVSKFGVLAQTAMLLAAAAVAKFAVDSIKAFSESQSVMAQTEAVIKSTGGAAGLTAEEVHGLAKAFEEQTAFSDEAVQSAENLILTFRHIGGDIVPRTTQAVLDMSTALGQDLKSSAIQLGKALDNPLVGLTALRRVGVSFTETQVELIKHFAETNQLAKAQKLILDEVAKEFGGSASKQTETLSGKLAQLNNAWNDFQEAVGQILTKYAPPLLDFLTKVAEGLSEIGNAAGTGLGDALTKDIKLFSDMSIQQGSLNEEGQKLAERLAGLHGPFGDLGKLVLYDNGLMEQAQQIFGDTGTKVDELGGTIRNFADMSGKDFKAWSEDVRTSIADAFSFDSYQKGWELTAKEFKKQLAGMAKEAIQFKADLADLSKAKWVPEDFKKWLIDTGPDAVHAFEALNHNAQEQAVQDWKKHESAVRDVGKAIDDLPTKKKIDVTVNNSQALSAIGTINAALANLQGSAALNVRLGVASGGILGGRLAEGGLIRGASGFVTRGPTYLVGEGTYSTRFGRGSEAVLPLTDDTLGRLGAAIAANVQPIVVPVVWSDEFDGRVGDSLTRSIMAGA